MRIGFAGAGKVGFTLGRLFAEGGIALSGYYSRTQASACAAAGFTGSQSFASLQMLAAESDVLFLTVPDGAIASVYRSLPQEQLSEKMICHCSGALTAAEAFPDIAACGAYGYSIHPLFPISDRLTAYRELPGAFFCIEGIGPHLPLWQEMLQSLGIRVQVIAAEAKIRYHAACAVSSNLVCGLMQESLELLKQCGFTEQTAIAALSPLMRSNLEHLIAEGPVHALTGPAERGDTETVQKHLACFAEPDDREIYRAVSKKLLQIAQEKHPARNYRELENLLH